MDTGLRRTTRRLGSLSWLVPLGLVAASVLVSCALVEAALRLVPNKYASGLAFTQNDRTTVRYQKLDSGLFVLEPGRGLRYHRPCIESSGIEVNDLGFRGASWPTPGSRPRLAVLGDSFLEALQVGEREHAGAILGRLLEADVLNAAVSGYSTLTELAVFRRFVRPHRPDLVLLFVFLGNDVQGNSCGLDANRVLCGTVDQGRAVIVDREAPGMAAEADTAAEGDDGDYVERDFPTRIRDALRRRLALYHALHDLRLVIEGAINHALGRVHDRWRLYMEPLPPAWADAWRVTEEAIDTLRRDTVADGARLAIVAIPEHFALSPNGRREIVLGTGSGAPANFDLALPGRRLGEIAARLGIPFLDLAPALLAYRDRVGLSYPYFSFTCEGHWNPLAHDLVAHEVAAFVAEMNLLPRPTAALSTIAEKRRAAFARRPEDILRAKAWAEIYKGGIYAGDGRAD